ncbi:hypothetical protein M9H77_37054 [Catharanthus roseus]|uniref:Uncharacterized protein n=1 Tax=Catharanthus roseus TaxID=4058 RepID=A0ACB9ZTJ9_CATRO|nr:hypothetical protein M9H77_37054 [Catharanthus roseus]
MACIVDFRCLDEGFGGKTYKRKRSLENAAALSGEHIDDMDVEDAVQPSKKQVRTHRASASNASKKKTTLEQRAREKELKKAYQERKKELKEEIRQNKIEKRKKREEREKRKQENILRSGTKLQKITNPKTLKKIAKSAKQRKLLKVVSDDVLHGNKKK